MAVERLTVGKWKSAIVGNGEWPAENGLTLRERYIALVLAVHMDKSGETWVSLDTLSKESRQSKHTVKKYVDSLEAKGWLLRVKGKSGQSAHTFASIKSGAPQDDTALGKPSGAVSDKSGAISSQSGAPQDSTRTPELHRTPREKFQKEIPGPDFFEEWNAGGES